MPHRLFRFSFVLALFAALLQAHSAFAEAQIDEMRMWRSPDKTRIVLDLDQAVEHSIFVLKNPDRVVVDIPHAALKADLSQLNWQGTPIENVRSGKHGQDSLRLVFDLSKSVKPRSFLLKKQANLKDRLVIDLLDSESKAPVIVHSSQSDNQHRDLIIAVDAGHGGEDPGALGPNKLYEKQVTLAIAKQLQAIFNQTKGYQAILVREGDYYVSLEDRRKIARKAKADLFVSIHADSFSKPSASGSSVFALSSRGATSTFARVLANRENSSDLVGGVSLSDKSDVLSSVLVDLSVTHKQEASINLAQSILNNISKITHLHSNRVELAAFMVLKTPDIPSVLVETGFISNPAESKKLSSARYQEKMASAIFQGVGQFFSQHAPDGSYIAWKNHQQNQEIRYVVSSGDTLSAIANRYAISANTIKHHNNLASNTIRVGQELLIPATQ